MNRDFLENNTIWTATLNNNEVVQYSGDNDSSDWLKLRDKCNRENLYITKFNISFRDNYVSMPDNMDGYFFCKMIRASMGSKNTNFFLVGYLQNEKVRVYKYRCPELIVDSDEYRSVEDCGECLIERKL